MAILKRTLIALGLIATASTAVAADGVLEINDACVADGCFAGDSPGFPVELGGAGSSYVLTSDLDVSDAGTTAISISASDVTLDLNGFTVQGPVSCTGTPVNSCTASSGGAGIAAGTNSTIGNGSVIGFGAVGIGAGPYNRLHDLRVEENGGGGISAGRGSTVQNCNVVRNGGVGVYSFTGDAMLELTNSIVAGNLSYGAQLATGLVRGNRFLNNGAEGLYGSAYTGSGNTYTTYVSNVFIGNNGGAAADQISGGMSMGCNMIVDAVQCSP